MCTSTTIEEIALQPQETVVEFSFPNGDNLATTSALPKINSELSLRIVTTPPVFNQTQERETSPSSPTPYDPLLLEARRKSDADIKREGKKVQAFYREQNELIDDFLAPLDNEEPSQRYNLKVKIAVNGSMIVNILLFGLQLYAAISSASLSLFATMADSFMDILSNATLVYTSRAANKKDTVKYPTGKARMETTGIIIFSTLMATLSLQIIIEAIKAFIGKHENDRITIWAVVCVVAALVAKSLLFCYCYFQRHNPSARILMLDHRNDIIVNSFGLMMSLLGNHLRWWLDPVGGILVALIILRAWVATAREHVQLIIGKSADTAVLQRLTYIALTHHEKILQVDTCRAYHAGNNIVAEVDIVMDRNTPLWECHDISEGLQIKLESLSNVDRAFVHVDYETSHKPEHQKRE
ncbi:hypothetical protein G9A89_010248 [Geosiphon pyriformis]|nr:hypothetical protein G9A89_010248 [Geosiphon pyriformis]